jgi:tetratricopeptide (TPR) repeat protein
MTEKPRHRLPLYRSFLIFACALSTTLPATKAAGKGTDHYVAAVEIADKAFWKMNYPKADSIYTAELHHNPGNVELYWRLARLQISLGESLEPDKTDERLHHYRKAAEYAKRCITLDSTIGKGHSWYAASLGLIADKIGTKEKIKQANEVKRELDCALRLNPNDETALSILGSYYFEAAQIGWFKRMLGNAFIGEVPKGNYDLAEKAFKKAIIIDSRIIRNYHELALIAIKKGNREEAVNLMKTALDKPVIMPGDRKRLEEMRLLMTKYSDK